MSAARGGPAPGTPATADLGSDVGRLRERFATGTPLTVGLEEEVLLVDPATWMPAPVATAVVEGIADGRAKPELPASQLELVTAPHRTATAAIEELASARRLLAAACRAGAGDEGPVVPVAAAVHPLVQGPVELAPTERGEALGAEYRTVAARQLVGALQVHVAVGDPDATLAVYNALRGHLPEIAALAAAAPFHEGRDSGLASVRPLIAGQLPRQGVPPAIPTWEAFAEDLRWGAATGWVSEPGRWWWELRPHVRYGTLEVRVPDVQPTVAGAEGVARFVLALVAHLAARHAAGEPLGAAPSWRIAENRWSALRDGLHGRLADLDTGAPVPTRERLARLVDLVEPHERAGLDATRALLDGGAADQLRAAGVGDAVAWLSEVFEPTAPAAPPPAAAPPAHPDGGP